MKREGLQGIRPDLFLSLSRLIAEQMPVDFGNLALKDKVLIQSHVTHVRGEGVEALKPLIRELFLILSY